MSKALAAPEAPALAQGQAWRPEGPGGPDARTDGGGLLARERALRLAQAERMAGQRAELGRAIENGTELAVRRLAGLEGISVQFPPLDPASGRDVTEQFRAPLRQMFQY